MCLLDESPLVISVQDSAGSGFDDYGGEVELHRVDFSDSKNSNSVLLGKARARF